MADPVGILSGTDAVLYVRTSTGDLPVGGVTTNSTALNNDLQEATSKSSDEYRYLIEGAGTQSVTHTLEAWWNSEDAFQQLLTNQNARSSDTYIFYYGVGDGVKADLFSFIIASNTLSSDLNTPVSSSITFENNGEFNTNFTSQFLIDSDSEELLDSNGNQLLSAG